MYFEEEDFISDKIVDKNNIFVLPSSDEKLRKVTNKKYKSIKPFRNNIKKNTFLAIGDIHFKHKSEKEIKILFESILQSTINLKPGFVVMLGDIVDTDSGTVRNFLSCLNKTNQFILELSKLCPTYIIIGNHDMTNTKTLMNSHHIFEYIKDFHNIIIVDEVIIDNTEPDNEEPIKIIFAPYVPSGRFFEALNTKYDHVFKNESIDTDIIFAHQDFKYSEQEIWPEDAPLMISGHIHERIISKNLLYIGTPYNVRYGENSAKSVSYFYKKELEDNAGVDIDHGKFMERRIYLDIPSKITLTMNVEEAKKFKKSDNNHYRIIIEDVKDNVDNFHGSCDHARLLKDDIKILIKLLGIQKESTERILENPRQYNFIEEMMKELEDKPGVKEIWKEIL